MRDFVDQVLIPHVYKQAVACVKKSTPMIGLATSSMTNLQVTSDPEVQGQRDSPVGSALAAFFGTASG